MIVPWGGFLLPSSRVQGVCPEGMVLDETDTCIMCCESHQCMISKLNQFPLVSSTGHDDILKTAALHVG